MRKFLFSTLIIFVCGLNAQTVDLTVEHTTAGSLGTEIAAALAAAGKDASEIMDTLFITGTAYLTLEDCFEVKASGIAAKVLDLKNALFENDSLPSQSTTSAGAFQANTLLKTVIFPPTLRVIGRKAFSGCTNLQTANFPNTVETIGSYAFNMIPSLEMSELPANLKYIGDAAFRGCVNLTISSLPASLEVLGDNTASAGNGAFRECAGITISEIPDNVEVLGQFVFASCPQLTTIVFPQGITSLGNGAFQDCTGLTDLYFKGATPPSAVLTSGGGKYITFNRVPLENVTCHVPVGSLTNYNTVGPWSSMNVVDDFTTKVGTSAIQEMKMIVNNNTIVVENIKSGENYALFSAIGQLINSGISHGNELTFNVSEKGVYMIRVGSQSAKFIVN